MPLLWNMVKSFIIRYRLQSSLPKAVRKHYSLIMDPAAGTVSVGIDTPWLDLRHLLHSAPEHRAGTRYFQNTKKDLLSEPWMGLESIGIHPHYDGTRKRFTVSYDLRVESVNLACYWPAFVVLSLALGVDSHRGGLLDLKRNISTNFREIILKSLDRDFISNATSIINARKQGSRVLAHVMPSYVRYSPLTALAWVGWMIETHERVVHVVPLRMPQFWQEAGGDRFTRNRHATHDLLIHPYTQRFQATERALVWVLYAENYYHNYKDDLGIATWGKVLPVTQEILKIREDIVEELKLIKDLEVSLIEIFPSEKSLVRASLDALGHEWDTQLEDKRKSRPYTENPSGYVDIWENLQDNDTFNSLKTNYHPIPTLRTRSDADLAQSTTPMAVLARLIIAVSSIQKWPREEWSVDLDGSFKVPADPMDELLGPWGRDELYGLVDDATFDLE